MLLALVGLSAAARPAAAGCRVRGEHVTLENVVVRADINRRRWTSTCPTSRRVPPSVLEAACASMCRARCSFRGTRKNVWFTVAREIAVANGVVHLAEGAELVHARADGDGVVASVVQWADDVLPGEDKDPDEVIVGVRVPCRAVRLGNKHGENDDDDDERRPRPPPMTPPRPTQRPNRIADSSPIPRLRSAGGETGGLAGAWPCVRRRGPTPPS